MSNNNFEFITKEEFASIEVDRMSYSGKGYFNSINNILNKKALKGRYVGLGGDTIECGPGEDPEIWSFTRSIEKEKVECDHKVGIRTNDFIVGEVTYRVEHCPKCCLPKGEIK